MNHNSSYHEPYYRSEVVEMKSITIHGIDNELDKLLQKKANLYGLSLNKTVKKLLSESLEGKKATKKRDLSKYFGTWTEKEYRKFEKAIESTERIDLEDWK